MACAYCETSIFAPSLFYKHFSLEFDQIEETKAYNRKLGIGTAVKPKTCSHIFHCLCFYAHYVELTQRKPNLRTQATSCFITGCKGMIKFWDDIIVFPLDHLIELKGEIVILSNQAVTIMRKAEEQRSAQKNGAMVTTLPLELYFREPEAGLSLENISFEPETQAIRECLLKKIKEKERVQETAATPSNSQLAIYNPPTSPISESEDDSDCVFLGEKKALPRCQSPPAAGRSRGKQLSVFGITSSDDSDDDDSDHSSWGSSPSVHSESENSEDTDEQEGSNLCNLPEKRDLENVQSTTAAVANTSQGKREGENNDGVEKKRQKVDEECNSQLVDLSGVCESLFASDPNVREDEELDFYKILGLEPETQRVTVEERMNDLTEEERGIFNDLSEMMGE